MKKILMVIAIAAMSVSFVACGGSTAKTEGDAATTTASSSSSIVDQYQVICDKMVELGPKVKSGDAAALEEYNKVMQDFSNFAQNNAEAFAKLTPAEAQKIQEMATKAAQAMQ